MIKPSDAESAQRIVSVMNAQQCRNALEHLAGTGAMDEFGPEYVGFVRGILLRRLDSLRRGRRGLMSIPDISGH